MATDANGNPIPDLDPQLAGILAASPPIAWPRPKKAASDVNIPPVVQPPNTDTGPVAPPIAYQDPSLFRSRGYVGEANVGRPPAPAPATPDTGSVATTQTPPAAATAPGSSVVPNALPFNRWSLTKPVYSQSTSDPLSGQITTPSYLQTSTDPNTGMPTAAGPQTKLGKLLSILRGAGLGAAVGSTQPTFGRGFMAANEWENQQALQNQAIQQGAARTALARQQLQLAPQELQLRQQQIQQQQALMPLQQRILEAQAQGLHTVYKQETDGSFTEQNYDNQGKPVGQPIKNVVSPQAMGWAFKPHVTPTAVKDPNGGPNPIFVGFNKITNKWEDLETGQDYPNQHLEKWVAPTPATIAQGIVGPAPGANATPEERSAYYQRLAAKTAELKRQGSTSLMAPNDVNDMVNGVMNGTVAPDLRNLPRGAGGQVQAELERRGFNLAQARLEWNATEKYMGSLNSGGQVVFRQRIQSAQDMLQTVKNLYSQWQATGLPTGYQTWNRAALKASEQLPGQAGATARALETQINELSADLATVFVGGNSPSDKALGQASTILGSDWNQEQFEGNMNLAEQNLAIRANSVASGMPAGVTGNNPYAPQKGPTGGAGGGGGGGNPPPAKSNYRPGFNPG